MAEKTEAAVVLWKAEVTVTTYFLSRAKDPEVLRAEAIGWVRDDVAEHVPVGRARISPVSPGEVPADGWDGSSYVHGTEELLGDDSPTLGDLLPRREARAPRGR